MAVDDDPHSRDGWDLMLRVTHRPYMCCGCIRIPRSDRKRARRVFRLTRAIMRDWRAERERLTDG